MALNLKIDKLPYSNLKEVGTLLFYEYPSTIVFKDSDNKPYILEWADVDDKNGVDLYYIFETTNLNLARYCRKAISHLELIQRAEGGIALFFSGKIEKPNDISITAIENVELKYLPSGDSFFDESHSSDYGKIESEFDLGSLNIEEDYIDDLEEREKGIKKLSKAYGAEIFNLHLNEGKHIKYGRAQTDVLGKALVSFEEFYKEVATDYIKGLKREKKLNKSQQAEFDFFANTEVVLSEAASFSIFIKPLSTQTVFDFEQSNSNVLLGASEKIFFAISEIISNSIDEQAIGKIKDNFNHAVFTKLKVFADNIISFELNIDMQYYSPVSEKTWNRNLDEIKANSIINTLANTTIVEKDKFKAKGKFSALNCKTGHYTFFTNEKAEHTGYFDKQIKDSMPELNFVDLYEITIEQAASKNIAEAEYKVNDTVVSCLRISK